MKNKLFFLFVLILFAYASCTQTVDTESTQEELPDLDYFQLTVYRYENQDQVDLLDHYFENALLPALHRAGVKNIGVFKPIEGLNEEEKFFMVLVPYNSLNHFEKITDQLEKDPEYQQDASAYIDAPYDQVPFTRKESFILRSFSSAPKMALPDLSSPRNERVYELRSYEAGTEKLYKLKVEMFNEGESELFRDLGFNPVMFCEVLSSSHMPHLMYLTTHADTAAQNKNWDAFRKHPEWDRMKNLERYKNTVSKITKYQLYPTEYSDY